MIDKGKDGKGKKRLGTLGLPLMPSGASRGACLLVDPHTTPGVWTKKKTTVKTSDDEVARLEFCIVSVGEVT